MRKCCICLKGTTTKKTFEPGALGDGEYGWAVGHTEGDDGKENTTPPGFRPRRHEGLETGFYKSRGGRQSLRMAEDRRTTALSGHREELALKTENVQEQGNAQTWGSLRARKLFLTEDTHREGQGRMFPGSVRGEAGIES